MARPFSVGAAVVVVLMACARHCCAQSGVETWDSRWYRNGTEGCYGSTANASCAELNGDFDYVPAGDYLWAEPHPSASTQGSANSSFHQTCNPTGNAINGPAAGQSVCGVALYRVYCAAPTWVNVRGEAQISPTARAGNDDSFYVSFDDRTPVPYHSNNAREPNWSIRNIFAGNQYLSAGPHTLRVAEREDGTRLRRLFFSYGFPDCAFGEPEPSSSDVLARVLQHETEMNNRIAGLETGMSSMQSSITAIQSTLAGMSSMQSSITAIQSTLAALSDSQRSVRPFNVGPSTGGIARPSVEAAGNEVRLSGSTIKINSAQCGDTDICELAQTVQAITSALRQQ